MLAVADQGLQHVVCHRHLGFLATLPHYVPPPQAALLAEAVHAVALEFAGPGRQHVEGGRDEAGPLVFVAPALRVPGHGLDGRRDGLPHLLVEKALDLLHLLGADHRPRATARVGGHLAAALPDQTQRVAQQIAGVHQVAHQGVDRGHRGEHGALAERADEGPPLFGHPFGLRPTPQGGRLRVGEKVEVGLEILPVEAGQRLAPLDQRPQQQPLALPLVDAQRAGRAVVLHEKATDGLGVAGRADLQAGRIGAVVAGAPVELGRDREFVEGAQRNGGGWGRFGLGPGREIRVHGPEFTSL